MAIVARGHSGKPDTSRLPTSPRTVANNSRSTLRRSLNTSLRPSSTLPGRLLTYTDESTHTTTRESLGQLRFPNNSLRRGLIQNACSPCITDRPLYGCVNMLCKQHTHNFVFQNCDDWKRHMKEHQAGWPWMPNGLFKTAGTDLICALCGSFDPDETHIAGHSFGECGNTSTQPRSFSRRITLEKHLSKSHGVSPNRTRGLADKWKTAPPRHFACGFCVCVFSTILEQLNHIDMDHFKKGQQITGWSVATVNQSLLLLPEVVIYLRDILLRGPYPKDRDLHWYEQMTKDSQRRLQIAEDAAKSLVLEAYRMLHPNLSYGSRASTSLSSVGFSSQSVLATNPFDILIESLETTNSDHRNEDLTRGSEHPWSSDHHHAAAPSSSYSMADAELSMNQNDVSEEDLIKNNGWSHHTVSRDSSAVSASSTAPLQPTYFPTQMGFGSDFTESSSRSAYETSGVIPHWQAVSSTTPSSLHSTGAANMPREQLGVSEGPTLELETGGTPILDLDYPNNSPSLESVSLPLRTCDNGQIQHWSSQDELSPHYDIDEEPKHARNFLQHDRHCSMEPLTCDPRDVVKK